MDVAVKKREQVCPISLLKQAVNAATTKNQIKRAPSPSLHLCNGPTNIVIVGFP